MSKEYDDYLIEHKANVKRAFAWMKENIPETLVDCKEDIEYQIEFGHDHSKTMSDEYNAYDRYFYGGNRSYAVVQAFNYAWLLHIHRNPHHWQHWMLINDDPKEGEAIMDMQYNYVIEMICDWWSFSWKAGNLYEIFTWYDDRKDYIKLSTNTRIVVEMILEKMRRKLEEGEKRWKK